MKKFLLFAIVFSATAFAAIAQTKKPTDVPIPNSSSITPIALMPDSPTAKGKWLAGVSFGVNSSSSNVLGQSYKSKQNSMLFQPGLSYFIKDNLAVGLVLGFTSYKDESDMVDEKSSGMFIAPSLRYYLPITNHFMLFGQLQIPVGASKTSINNGNVVDEKVQTFGVNISPSFAFFPTKKISIEMNLGTIFFQSKKYENSKSNDLGVAVFGGHILGDDFLFSFPALGFSFHL